MAKKKILLIDDELVIQSLLRRLLAKMRCDAVITGGIQEALRQIEGLPDLSMLITDLKLPDGDPVTVVRLVREKYPAAKVLVITGSLSIPEEQSTQLRQMGVTEKDILFKPFEIADFESMIHRHMSAA